MSDDPRHHVPAFNLNRAVRNFHYTVGRTINMFDASQVGSHVGTQLELMANKIEAVLSGCVTNDAGDKLRLLIATLKMNATEFKQGMHYGDALRGDREEMLYADIKLAATSISAGYMVSNNFDGACVYIAACELMNTNPPAFRPDLSRYVTLAAE